MIPYLLLPRYFKYIGLVLVIAGYTLAELLPAEADDVAQPSGLLVQLLILFGFLFIAGARQKTEDEMIRHIRLRALQWSVFLFIGLRVFYKCMAYYTHDVTWLPQWQSNSLLLFYLALFYYQLYVPQWLSRFRKESHEE